MQNFVGNAATMSEKYIPTQTIFHIWEGMEKHGDTVTENDPQRHVSSMSVCQEKMNACNACPQNVACDPCKVPQKSLATLDGIHFSDKTPITMMITESNSDFH